MLKNYFKIAWRNINAQKFYSVVNIIGLSAGIAFAFLIAAYVWGELQVNKNIANGQDQYIIQSKWKNPDMGLELTTLGPLAKNLKEQYPDLVANYYRWDGITSTVSKDEKAFREGLQVGDSTFLNMYGFDLMYGNTRTAFNNPFSVVITAEAAVKYFNRKDVSGQTITIENFSGIRHEFLITGVLKPISRNSVVLLNDDNRNQFFIGERDLAWFGRDINQWLNPYVVSYIQLQPGVKASDLQPAFQQLLKTHTSAAVAANLQPYAVPLSEYYLSSNNGVIRKMLFAVALISLFILLMAVINFINISSSRAATRIKEVGIRKVLGGLKKQLILQFLSESVLLVAISTLIALIIYQLSFPWFGNLFERQLPSLTDYTVEFWLVPFILTFVVGLLSGLYPAFKLSSINTAVAVKGKFNSAKEKLWSRKLLVGIQFATTVFVLITAIIVAKQTNYFFKKDLGYNKDYIITAQLPRNWSPAGVQKMQVVKKQIQTLPQVSAASIAFEIQDGKSAGNVQLYKYGQDSSQAITAPFLTTDEDYLKTYSIQLIAGTYFSNSIADTFKLVVNEKHSKALGFSNPEDAVGQLVRLQGSPFNWIISGVTRDFNFGSLQEQIKPVVMMNMLANPIYRYISIKLKPGNINSSIKAVESQWKKLMPSTPFEYSFMDDKLAALYKTELQLQQAAYVATLLALIIVLLGVIGLISLNIQKRIKEIGIRKVMGSSALGIVQLFVKEFLWVMLSAITIACPLIYFVMKRWLNTYAYRIELNIWPFITGIVILGGITVLLIGLQTIRVAFMNPVKSLRTE